MAISRRKFLEEAATVAGAALAAGVAASTVGAATRAVGGTTEPAGGMAAGVGGEGGAGAVTISSSMGMGSGAPLGGIGTGFIELRADGCFYEWLIFNGGQWSPKQPKGQTGGQPVTGPLTLQFLLRTGKPGGGESKVRRLYLRSQDADQYSLAYVQDVESIECDAWYPMTGLRYGDPTLPVRVSATAFSPFIPGKTRDSGTPGFHLVFTIENTSSDAVEASVLSLLQNPLASGLDDRELSNTIGHEGDSTSLLMRTDAQPVSKASVGSLCLAVSGGEHSWISGTYEQYALPGMCRWATPRLNRMLLDVVQEFYDTGKLANTEASGDLGKGFTLDAAEIDGLSSDQLKAWVGKLSGDALFKRVIDDARAANPQGGDDLIRAVLKEIRANIATTLVGTGNHRSSWGTGALASSVVLGPGERAEIRFTLSWFFPHHFSPRGPDMGHMYANWFNDAGEVNQFLQANYDGHRRETEGFARVLADTSLDSSMSFGWSSHLATAVTNTWWVKDGGYAIWEGLGCCGLSTTDVDYNGSFPVAALFPELKLGQMKRIIQFQDAEGEVPHNYGSDFEHIDQGGWGRVDMNPQFVMMVCRDYLWTGDKDYLQAMWPHVVSAMDHTGSLDSDGDGLPDTDCGFQTYDQWRMQGAPSYIASLWIGALRAAVRVATELNEAARAGAWKNLLDKASASFDRVMFNGKYYSLWVDGKARDETCMTDQLSGEWFTHLIGLPTTISETNLATAMSSILKNNFNAETGLRNASAPRGGLALLVMDNLQAGGVWSGIEFAFASALMDRGRFAEGAAVVAAVHRRYMRAGMPWNHVECGSHYSRAMSSWATLLAATGFKPDVPAQTLTVKPAVAGDFRAPWATASGFGRIGRDGGKLTIGCEYGGLSFKRLRVDLVSEKPTVRLSGGQVEYQVTRDEGGASIEFGSAVTIGAGEYLAVE